ncbi:MAG: hypothetical protein ACK5MY_12020 [Jhaorihella sp.]
MIAFANVMVFDGIHDGTRSLNVTVEGERIRTVSDAPAPVGSRSIGCGGRALMPGLTDAHIYDLNVNRLQHLTAKSKAAGRSCRTAHGSRMASGKHC